MNQNIPSPLSTSSVKTEGHQGMKLLVSALVFLLAGFITYSVLVAVSEPDPQETIVLGQTRLASGSPAAVRVLVRNRLTGNPIRGAKIRLALAGKSTVRLGEFETDALGSIGETIYCRRLRLAITSCSSTRLRTWAAIISREKWRCSDRRGYYFRQTNRSTSRARLFIFGVSC